MTADDRAPGRTRFWYLAAWAALAFATLVTILVVDGNSTRWAIAFLAWVGGILSDRLYLQHRGRSDL